MVNECRLHATSTEIAEKEQKALVSCPLAVRVQKRTSVVPESFFGRRQVQARQVRVRAEPPADCSSVIQYSTHCVVVLLVSIPATQSVMTVAMQALLLVAAACLMSSPAMAERAAGTATWPRILFVHVDALKACL